MDPLSLTASIITILGVGGKATKAIGSLALFKDAPDAILALNNELSDLRLVVAAIEEAFERQETSGIPFPGRRVYDLSVEACIVSSLQQVKEKILELEASFTRLKPAVLGSSSSTPRNLYKRFWRLEHKMMKRMQEDLRSARLKLVSALDVLHSSSLNRLETGFRGVNTKIEKLQSDQHQISRISHQLFSSQENALQELHSRISQLQTDQRHMEVHYSQELRRTETTLHRPIMSILAAQRSLEKKTDIIEAATATKPTQTMAKLMLQPPPSTFTNSAHSVHIPAVITRWKCSDCCTCVCHARVLAKTPHILERFLGVLFVGYTGIPRISPSCNVKPCAQRSGPMATIMYLFPAWFLARAMSIAVRLSCHDGPQFNLRVSRRVAGHSAILMYSSMGDVTNVKEILNQRLGSPFDIDADTGETALMLAVRNVKPEVCKVLLSVGADPYYDHPTRGNAFDYAWNAIVYNNGDATARESLNAIFSYDDMSERSGFTVLHKVVVGLNKLDLVTLLDSLSRVAINKCDAKGRSAAWWAARRGDSLVLSTLIKYGADIDVMNDGRASPLDAAIDSRRSDCIWMLLRSGLNNTRPLRANNGWTSLHRSCYAGSDLDIVEWLIEQGADIEAHARYDLTPLHLASMEGNDSIVECLMSKGACVDTRAVTGDTLHAAIAQNRHKVIQLLIRHDADCSIQTVAGETILHHAAQFGNIDTVRTLRSFKLPGVGLFERVKAASLTQKMAKIKGLTALEIAERRKDVSQEWLATFRQLVHDIEFPELGAFAGAQSEEGFFEDALEYQN